MKKYFPNEIEPAWQERWDFDHLYNTDLTKSGHKYYVLAEWAYPSGDLHMGHWFTFALTDLVARFKRMQGFNVLFPNGFDAFGLPAENAAIKRGIHPQDWTLANIERMKQQFATMGAAFDWEHSAISCLPEYYKWNQWIFLKMYEKGLAYRGKALANWCPSCQTVLANENLEGGKCWRCGTEVVQQEVDQWFLKITAYADKLIWPTRSGVDWPKSLKEAQNNWIGKSRGIVIKFSKDGDSLDVFTTRPDTLFGATFLVISPEHPVLTELASSIRQTGGQNSKVKEVEGYVKEAKKKSELERKENKEKTGVFSGIYVKNPLSGEKIPVWVADYVLPGYGTGAIMAVPAHDQRDFEFAKKHGLEIREVIQPVIARDVPEQYVPKQSQSKEEIASPSARNDKEEAYEGEGVLVNSGEYTGLPSKEAWKKISDYLVKHQLGMYYTSYHLRDWSISRQRYWGTPIPMIYCGKDGVVPVPEKDLPVELPYKVDYAPKGKSPLATAGEWVNVTCPKCGGPAKREVETMDTFVDSSWYFFRYLDPHDLEKIFDKKVVDQWMPVDIYVGGAEHTLGHALYSRFFTKFLHDLGLYDHEEYALRRVHHGLILGTDGQKMSKSRGNVINPDQEVKTWGADAVRTYLAFLGPYDIVAPWNAENVGGVYRFLERVWNLAEKVESDPEKGTSLIVPKDLHIMHKTIKKVGEDLENIHFNTAVAALMEWLNHLSRKAHSGKVSLEEYKTFLLLLSPIAPHITEELWQMMGGSYSIHQQSWPKYEEKYLEEEELVVVAQVNGKVRDNLLIGREMVSKREEVEKLGRESIKIQKFLEGKEVKKVIYIPGKILNFVVV